MPTAPTGQQRHYNPISLDKWFAISCVVFLISLIWMFMDDYNREWRKYQKQFRKLEIKKTSAALDAEREALLASGEYTSAQSELDQAAAELDSKAAELDAAIETRSTREKQYQRAMQLYNFKKANLDASKYAFEQANSHHHGDPVKTRQRMDTLGAESAELELAAEKAQMNLAAAEAEIASITAQNRSVERQLSKLTRRRGLMERKIKSLDRKEMTMLNKVADIVRDMPVLDMLNPYYNVKERQLIVNGITDDVIFSRVDKVDRCMVCHLGVANAAFADVKDQPLSAHPRLDLFVKDSSPHPFKEFGCTSCHSGRGRATSFTSAVHMPGSAAQKKDWEDEYHWKKLHYWDEPMYPLKYTEAGCFQCHSGAPVIKGADTLSLGLALVERAGCYACHAMGAFKDKPKPGPSLRRVAAKVSKDWSYLWIKDPKSFREHTWMPSFFGQSNNEHIESRTDQEIKAMVAYLFAHSEPYEMESAPQGDGARGEQLVKSLGCLACHNIDPNRERPETITAATLRKEHGPSLTGLGVKTTRDWVFNWIREPTRYHNATRMPNLRLSDQQAADIASYLCDSEIGQHDSFAAQSAPDANSAVIEKVALDYLSSLMTHSQAEQKLAAMSHEEILLETGERLIRHYGCFGCHDIPGFESDKPIGVELTEEGSKPVVKLDFGNLHDEVEHVNYAWFDKKLEDPRAFDRGKADTKGVRDYLKMPNFHLTQHERDAIVTVLLGMKKPDPGLTKMMPRTPGNLFVEQGEKLLRQFNCRACHEMEHGGGDISVAIADWYRTYKATAGDAEEDDSWGDDDADEDDPEFLSQVKSYSPPRLIGEGSKVQPDWLFHFLENPAAVRPWLEVRMPTFPLSDEQRNTLVKYFNYLDDQAFPFAAKRDPHTSGEVYTAGERLFSDDVFQCQRCHIKGDDMPAGTPDMWAPDLTQVAKRLKPGWVIEWLRDPQVLMPGTKMPGFFPDGATSQADLDRDVDRQMAALRDYLYTLGGE